VGLALEVGMLADLLVNDEEGSSWFGEDMAKLNGVLARAGLAAHADPERAEVFSTGTYGYSGLHYLRYCAAHLHYNGALPPPIQQDDDPSGDPTYARYSEEFEIENEGADPGVFAKPSRRAFDHLIMHSDAEGFYLPQRFERVLISGAEAYGWVGSSFALQAECERLAAALRLPRDMLADAESAALYEAIQAAKPRKGLFSVFKGRRAPEEPWRQHPVAALMCAKLHVFAGHSIRTGAALVFC
jgi:hypothetical protein